MLHIIYYITPYYTYTTPTPTSAELSLTATSSNLLIISSVVRAVGPRRVVSCDAGRIRLVQVVTAAVRIRYSAACGVVVVVVV